MLKKIIVAIAFFAVCIIFAARYMRKVEPSDFENANGKWIYSFSSELKESIQLHYRGDTSLSWIEVTFSNNRVLRYCANKCYTKISSWSDPAGRTRVWPWTTIIRRLSNEGNLEIGQDFISHAGSIIDTMRIIAVRTPVKLSEIALSKKIFKQKSVSKESLLDLKRVFPLKKIDMPASIEDGHVQTWEYITVSPDGSCCGVSSFDGNLYVINALTGNICWKYDIPDGKLSAIAYTSKGRFLLAGEHSVDGNVYCFDSRNGELCWKYRTANDIGSLENTLIVGGRWGGVVKPNAREIVVGNDSLAYIRARRSRYYEENGERKKQEISRLYCLNVKTGKTGWLFPPDSNLHDVSSSVINISSDGKYLSWVYFDYDKPINPVIIVFNAHTGEVLWRYQTNTVEKYFRSSTAYSGLCFSRDSRYCAVPLNDGRVFVFDNLLSARSGQGEVYKVLNITPPIDAGEVPVMTYMTKMAFTYQGDIVALTGNTYTTPFASTKIPPVYHPHATSVFCFSIDGDLKWRFTAGGNPSDLLLSNGDSGEYLILPCAHNIRSKDINEHGFYLFDISGSGGGFSHLMSYYHTNGICVNATLSPNQKRLFAIEAPIDMDESIRERLEGRHRILFIDFQPKHVHPQMPAVNNGSTGNRETGNFK